MPVRLEVCAAIVLAAGSSRRFGENNKLLAPFNGAPLLSYVLAVVAGLPLKQRLVVTGHDNLRVAALVQTFGLPTVFNPRHAEGMGVSIATGARVLSDAAEAVFIVPGDMPLITGAHFADLAERLDGSDSICRPVVDSSPGHPVLFGGAYFAQLADLRGESGARDVIRNAREHLIEVVLPDASGAFDVDRPGDLAL